MVELFIKLLKNNLFLIFYYLLLVVIYVLLFPFLIISIFKEKYRDSIPSRFFLKGFKTFSNNKIWFHTCSLGETVAIKPIIEKLQQNGISISDINISTITKTGLNEAKKITNNSLYLPFELFLPFWIKSQKVLVVMEAELWYLLFFIAKFRGAKTFLINARISDKSVKSYNRFRWFYKMIFNNIDKVFCQTKIDKDRLEYLGAKNIEIIGNIKISKLAEISKKYQKPKNKEIITIASSHNGEEEMILNSIDNLNNRKLIIVPRHPERFDEVENLIKKYAQNKKYSYSRFSKDRNFDTDIILVDMIGELINIYAITDIAILCGSFQKIGGHNPVEPASFNCKIISGKEFFNQKALYEAIDNIKIIEIKELKEVLNHSSNLKNSLIKSIGSIEPILQDINLEIKK